MNSGNVTGATMEGLIREAILHVMLCANTLNDNSVDIPACSHTTMSTEEPAGVSNLLVSNNKYSPTGKVC